MPPTAAIRSASEVDRPRIVEMARELVAAADTYAFDRDVTDEQLAEYFAPAGSGDGYVAEVEDRVVGAFVIRPNQPGPGSHVANASFVVGKDARGMGLGRQMGEASLALAAELGYRSMQFNIVIATNEPAIRLWRSLGFEVIGTVPEGFRLPDGRLVDHHVMYRRLD